jgi:Ca2+-dependent lipid-binding protein
LMAQFPHVKTLDLSFLERPDFDYVLKPIGGDTFGFDIGNVKLLTVFANSQIPGLSNFIREQVHANLGPMMYGSSPRST